LQPLTKEKNISPAILEDVIKWLYQQNIADAFSKVAALLDAAEYFQIDGLKEICSQMLTRTLKVAVLWIQTITGIFDLDLKSYSGKHCTDACTESVRARKIYDYSNILKEYIDGLELVPVLVL
jgi:uncharacterized protein Yka (UPF0111/DUF47 family)